MPSAEGSATDRRVPVPITDDGGVVKILMESGDPCKLHPKWLVGSKAVFHFRMHTIPFERKQDPGNWFKSGRALAQLYSGDMKESHKRNVGMQDGGKESDAHPCHQRVDPNRRTKVGDSRQWDGEPFELHIGRGFSVQVLELAVKTMRIGEKARFYCTPQYAEVFSTEAALRRVRKSRRSARSMNATRFQCTNACINEMQENRDLYDLIGCPLELELELLQVSEPLSSGTSNPQNALLSCVQEHRAFGTRMFHQGDFSTALRSFQSGIDVVHDQERRGQHLTAEIRGHYLVCLLNAAACHSKLKQWEEVVQKCSLVLQLEPQNCKALYRRSQALDRLREENI